MRKIERIFIHCTATPQNWTVAQIMSIFKSRGWKRPGYHYLVYPDGSLANLLDERLVANGVRGYNSTSIHVAYIGGIDHNGKPIDNRTDAQKKALRQIVETLRQRHPYAFVLGHRDISPDNNHNGKVDPCERIKECPCFNAIDEYGCA